MIGNFGRRFGHLRDVGGNLATLKGVPSYDSSEYFIE
jgi:hypothetical protein